MIKRHFGSLNTGSGCVVVFLEIPEKEGYSLVVEHEALPPRYADTFFEIVNQDGQNTGDLAALLNTRRFPDGQIILQALHADGHLKPIQTSRIKMFVEGSKTMPLVDIVNALRAQQRKPLLKTDVLPEVAVDPKNKSAKDLLGEARVLEDKAQALKDQAYTMDPSLKRGRKPGKKAV